MMALSDKSRVRWLDVLRGFAILLVVLFHFTFRYTEKYPRNPFQEAPLVGLSFGWIGVHLFFMISGFIIYMTIQKKQGPIHFLIARLSRLVPPYWVAILLILALGPMYRSAMGDDRSVNLAAVLANLAMAPDLLHYEALDGAFWSLYVELKFYIVFALLWKLVDLKSHRNLLLSYIGIIAILLVHHHLRRVPFGEDLGYFPIFWTGIAAYKLLHESLSLWTYAAITAVTTASTWGYYSAGPELLVGIPMFALLFATVEKLFVAHPSLERLFNPLAILGRVSYSYYLVHQPIGYLVLGMLAVTAIGYHFALIAAIAACFAVALLGFTFIEQLDKPIGKSFFSAYTRFAMRVGIAQR